MPDVDIRQTALDACAQVLGLTDLPGGASFLELGGDSLLAADAANRLARTLQIEVPVESLLGSATVFDFADAVVARARDASSTHPAGVVARAGSPTTAPLSYQQEEVWFLNELQPDNRAYQFQCTVTFDGDLRPELLERAINAVVERHDIFRTVFVDTDGQPRQVVQPRYRVYLPTVDLSAVADEDRTAALEQIVREEVAVAIDPGRLPLVRFKLVRLAPDRHVLVHVEHHLVHDGWSLAVLWREIESLYTAWVRGEEPALPPLPVQYGDYAVWQRERFRGALRDRLLGHWSDQLRELPAPLELAPDRKRPDRQSFTGDARRVGLPSDLYADVRAFSRQHGVSLFATMFAAFSALVHRYTGAVDLPIGSAVANRQANGAEDLIGMIVNTVVIRTRVDRGAAFRTFLAHTRDVVLAALAHQEAPFPEVVRAVNPVRDLSRNPLVQLSFSFHDSAVPDLEMPGVSASITERSNETAKFDLNVIVVPRAEQRRGRRTRADDQLAMIWEFNSDILTMEQVDDLVDRYQALLRTVVADPDVRLADLPSWQATPAVSNRPGAAPEPGVAETGAETDRLENILLSLWAELLERPDVAADDNFLHIGGHSLLAMRASSRLRHEHGIRVPVHEILENPTAARLACVISARRR